MHWGDCREKLNPDIEGSMTKSILEAGKILTGKDDGNCKDMLEEGK